MARISYDTRAPRQAADAHAGRLSDARHRGIAGGSAKSSTRWWWWATPPCAICSSGRASTRSGRARTGRSPKSKWPRASATTTSLTSRPAGAACCRFIRRRGCTARRSSAGTWARTRRPACWRWIWRTKTALVAIMDIGTNTELIVGNRHRILAASCPAGPAFEGGAIACGMPALDGAIEDVAHGERRRLPARRDRRHGARRASAGPAWWI